jgi:hypothetical protein
MQSAGRLGRRQARKAVMTAETESIADRLDKTYAPAWKPEPGEKIIGELISVDERLGYNDEPYPILTLRQNDGGELAVHAFHSVLRNEVGKLNPQLGETIAVKYQGEVAKEGGRGRYHSYRVVVDRTQSTVNLSKYADESDAPIDTAGLPESSTTQPVAGDDLLPV